VTFEDAPSKPWSIDGVEVEAALVSHRGPTLGYRLSENGTSICYLPDHEPALGQDLETSPAGWISGHVLARDASLLIHDGQFDEAEYRAHRGWGHSGFPDALAFAHRAEAGRTLLFHHDPEHDDARLESIGAEATERWAALDGQGEITMAREGDEIEV
jgi:ribonuclease BN (tRNA processing enzyme)